MCGPPFGCAGTSVSPDRADVLAAVLATMLQADAAAKPPAASPPAILAIVPGKRADGRWRRCSVCWPRRKSFAVEMSRFRLLSLAGAFFMAHG